MQIDVPKKLQIIARELMTSFLENDVIFSMMSQTDQILYISLVFY